MDADEPTAYDDAVIGDSVRCRCCGASWDVSEITVYGGDMHICVECDERDRDDLLVEVVRLREALAWYADPAQYGRWSLPRRDGRQSRLVGEVDRDRGARARAALKAAVNGR